MPSLDGFAFSQALFQIRLIAAGFSSVVQLADSLQINRAVMGHYSRGALPALEVRQAIAQALGVEHETLWVPTKLNA